MTNFKFGVLGILIVAIAVVGSYFLVGAMIRGTTQKTPHEGIVFETGCYTSRSTVGISEFGIDGVPPSGKHYNTDQTTCLMLSKNLGARITYIVTDDKFLSDAKLVR